MCSLSKEQSILSRETHFFQNYAPFSTWTFLTFVISVITEDIDLKFGVCVHYPKSNPYRQGRQFKIHFLFRIMPLFSSPEHNVLKGAFRVVRCPSYVICSVSSTISLNIFSSQTAGPIWAKLGRNVPKEVLFKNC